MTYEILIDKLDGLIPGCIVLCVKEYHTSPEVDGDYHYHIFITHEKKGISKNVYLKRFRKSFEGIFGGMAIDVRGVNSPTGTIDYLTKNVSLGEILDFLDGKGNTDHVITNDKHYWVKKYIKDAPGLKPAFIAHRMKNYSSLREWQVSSVRNVGLCAKNITSVQRIWRMKESIKPPKEVLPKYVDKISYISQIYPPEHFVSVCNKYNISPFHYIAFSHVIFGLILREELTPTENKTKRLVVRGISNTGKTRIISALRDFFHSRIFYEVGSRRNDFSDFRPSQKPLVIWDDCFGNIPGSSRTKLGWDKRRLLKLLGLEPVKIDVKYGFPIEVKTNFNILLTNDPFVLQTRKTDANLLARLKLVNIPDGCQAHWDKVTEEDMEILVVTALFNLTQILSSKELELIDSLHWGNGRHIVKECNDCWILLPHDTNKDPIKITIINYAPTFNFPEENIKVLCKRKGKKK